MRILIPILHLYALSLKSSQNPMWAYLRNHIFETINTSLYAQGIFTSRMGKFLAQMISKSTHQETRDS